MLDLRFMFIIWNLSLFYYTLGKAGIEILDTTFTIENIGHGHISQVRREKKHREYKKYKY